MPGQPQNFADETTGVLCHTPAMGFLSNRQHDRSRFYDSLATALEAGLTAAQALSTLAASGDQTSARLVPRLARGEPLSQGMSQDQAFSRFEILATEAGERSGRLPPVFRRLGRSFSLRGKTRDRIAYALIYPILLLHGVVLLPPLYLVFRDGLDRYLAAVVPALALTYLVFGTAAWLIRGFTASTAGRLTRDRWMLRLPGISKAVRSMALAEYAHSFAILLTAGVPMHETLARAAEAPRNRVFRAAGLRVCDRVRAGGTLREGLAAELDVFPQTFVQAVAVGESAGKLEDTLDRAAEQARQEAERASLALAVALGTVAYGIAALAVAWVVLRFFVGLAELPAGI
ncbi:MAG: type II secretion system F family protein [Thermoanaerobaculia bacterium]|nr:type II secretion system F family protein [Thermoanaerobaculia bacterium]